MIQVIIILILSQFKGVELLKEAEVGNLPKVKELLIDTKVNINFADPKTRQTALHLAVLGNHTELVSFLLEDDANPFAEDIHGSAPKDICIDNSDRIDPKISFLFQKHSALLSFFTSVERDDFAEVQRLLMHGIDITSKRKGFTPLHLAATRGSRNVLEALLKADKAIEHIDILSEDGKTPLHCATMNKQVLSFFSY